jgi:hypothetical protein
MTWLPITPVNAREERSAGSPRIAILRFGVYNWPMSL